jgi:hypothetical protein
MKANEFGAILLVKEVTMHSIFDHFSEFNKAICLGKNGFVERSRNIAAVNVFFN